MLFSWLRARRRRAVGRRPFSPAVEETLLGVLPINRLIVNDPDRTVGELMQPPVVKLLQHEKADEAARAFERYDLVSAPVVDTNDRIVGRVTVDEILDFVRESGEEDVLAKAQNLDDLARRIANAKQGIFDDAETVARKAAKELER